jgi:hypothetical protein
MKDLLNDDEVIQDIITVCNDYEEAKEAFSTAEDLIEAYPIGLANEFRNALFHLVGALKQDTKLGCLKDLDEVKDHLRRSIYDGYEISVIHLTDFIESYEKQYPKDKIIKIVPSYYTEILPYLEEIRADLVSERIVRKKWNNYKEVIEKLKNYKKFLLTNVPNVNHKQVWNFYWFYLIIGSVFGSLLTMFILK